MGKLTYGMNVSVDGYIADTNGDIGWSDPDAELHQYWNDQVRDTAVSLYGRKLYELMSAHWPTADEAPDVSSVQAEFARLWRAMPKVVFSKTLDSVGWNSRLERGDQASGRVADGVVMRLFLSSSRAFCLLTPDF